MAVADTRFIIDVLSGDVAARSKLDELVARNEPLWMPAEVLHEREYGAGLHRAAERARARIRTIEAAVPVVAFDAAQARVAGEMEARPERAGKRPGRVDVQVAALAQIRGEPVLTRDARSSRAAASASRSIEAPRGAVIRVHPGKVVDCAQAPRLDSPAKGITDGDD